MTPLIVAKGEWADMRRLRIGLFNDSFFPMIDGVAMVVDQYARRMSQYADVTVFAPKMGEYEFDRLPYRTVLSKSIPAGHNDYRIPLASMDPSFHHTLEASELDLVHSHSPFFIGKAGIRYAKRNGIPSVATLHTQFHLEFDRVTRTKRLTKLAVSRMMRVFDDADEVWTLNERMAKLYTETYGGVKVPVIVRNATDLRPCDKTLAIGRINQEYALGPGERVLLYVGRMDSLKNISTIIGALDLLKNRSDLPCKMLFVGAGKDQASYMEEVSRKGLSDRAIFCGRITDRAFLAQIYARADLFLLPSLFDASSLVQIEAASQGTPTLFVRGSVTSASVVDGENGFLCDNTHASVAARIEEIFRSPECLARAGEGARRDLYRTWEEAADEAYERYRRLTAPLATRVI